MSADFIQGNKYTRDDVWSFYHPDEGKRPPGGQWVGGYIAEGCDLVIFANIGVPGNTGHDFPNKIIDGEDRLVWYGKPNTHSEQPLMQKVINGELRLLFFARWDNSNPEWTFLGVGSVEKFQDKMEWKPDNYALQFQISINQLQEIAKVSAVTESPELESPSRQLYANADQTIFAMEKYLEEFIVSNWSKTDLGKNYDIFTEEGEEVGNQFPTDTGQIDILAISKNKKEFLVIELKRGRASDKVVGQIQSYMGYVAGEMAADDQTVKGCIIALEDSLRLRRSLMVAPNIEFFTYEVSFSLKPH